MTLDEQIAWLEGEACKHLNGAAYNEESARQEDEEDDGDSTLARLCRDEAARHRERAATLLTIENTLRAMRDAQR